MEMFSDNLSARVLRILDEQRLSYEAAAELCGMSSRHLGSIVRRRASPTIDMFERLCRGLGTTPDELLLGERRSPRALRVELQRSGLAGCYCCRALGCGREALLELEGRFLPGLETQEAILILPERQE